MRRCEITASLYLRGKTYGEIAKHHGLSLNTVKDDMKRARKLWRKRAVRTYSKHLHEQLARLDEVECAAWVGWERSLRDELTTSTEDGSRGEHAVDLLKTTRVKKSGNASFLKVIMDTVRQRSELLGLLDPDVRNESEKQEAQVMTVVVASREEAAEFTTISMNKYRDLSQQEDDETEPQEIAG